MSENVTVLFLIVINLFSSLEATCDLYTNSDSAAAKNALPIDYPRYSCVPCGIQTGQEVHIINMYQPVGHFRMDDGVPTDVKTVPIYLINSMNDTTQPVITKLLLLSYEAVHWEIHNVGNVTISQVILMSHYSLYSSVKLNDGLSLKVTARQGSFPLKDSKEAIQYATSHLGSVASYTAVYETSEWSLTIGDCLARSLLLTTTTIHPDATGECHFKVDSRDRSADISSPSRGDYPIYSCTPCVQADFEVHILNMYTPRGAWRPHRGPPYEVKKVPVIIKADNLTDIKLMLISYEAAHYVITKPATVNIREIALYSRYINYTTVEVENSTQPKVSSYGSYISGWESEWSLKNFVWAKFGFISSFTGVRETYSWRLTVGKCTSEPVNLTALMQTTTLQPIITTTFGIPSKSGTLNVAASIAIVLAIVIVFIIVIAMCVYKCRRKSTARYPNYSYQTSTGVHIPAPAPMAPLVPSDSAPTSTPSAPPAPLAQPGNDEAPPAYDEAMNYPLATGAKAEHQPPAYNKDLY